VFLLNPVLCSGRKTWRALNILESRGVDPAKIIIISLVSSPEAIRRILTKYPQTNMISAAVDRGLNASGEVVPGVGHFADRYFGT